MEYFMKTIGMILILLLASQSGIVFSDGGEVIHRLKGKKIQLYSEPKVKSRFMESEEIQFINASMPLNGSVKKGIYYQITLKNDEKVWLKKSKLIVKSGSFKLPLCNDKLAHSGGDTYAATSGVGLGCE
jgi:hypothetical protein